MKGVTRIYCCYLQNMYVSFKHAKNIKNYAVILRLVSDVFPTLMQYS